jgi:peptide/histidine transporter 3/4
VPTIEDAISAAAAAGALPAALAQQQAQHSAAVGIGGRRGRAALQGEPAAEVYGRSLAFLPASPALPAPFR